MKLLRAVLTASTLFGGASLVYAEEATTTTTTEETEVVDEFDEFEEFDEFDEQEETSDPLKGFNKVMFDVNEGLLKYVLSPIAKGYSYIMPEAGREGVERMFDNARYPIRAVNNLLQFKFKNAGEETGRFLVNTTGGVLGFYDNADEWFELEAHKEDFGQTLGHWGVGSGAPLTLPLMGPSNVRDAIGKVPDYFLDPVNWINPAAASMGVSAADKVNYTAEHEDEYWTLRKDALDPYSFFRDAYEKRRESKIKE